MPMPNVMGLYSVEFQNGITTFILGHGEKQARTLAQEALSDKSVVSVVGFNENSQWLS